MKKMLAGGLGLSLSLWAAHADGQTARPVAILGRPQAVAQPAAVALDRPVPLAGATARPGEVRPVSYVGTSSPRPLIRAQSPEYSSTEGGWIPVLTQTGGQNVRPDYLPTAGQGGSPMPPPMPPPSADPFYPSPPPYPGGGMGMPPPPPSGGPLGCGPCQEYVGGWTNFQSDHCFDGFISPVSNPLLFEDPRSLTELRPIFMLQTIPNSQWLFQGGNIAYFGLQARVAFTERLSLVLHSLGGMSINPGNASALDSSSGFAEVHLGPKYTFLRNETSRTLGAFGLMFQIPAGGSSVFQDTGDLSLVPYVTLAQNFWRTSYGSFNGMWTSGYAFGTSSDRTDQFYTSLHLDYNIAEANKFYPLIELHWMNYPQSGKVRNLDFEGKDLINFGSTQVSGNNIFTMAAGARYKFSESAQVGLAAEFPLNGRNDIFDFRFTIDFIWRY